MRLYDLFENENSNLVVIYPGRFHPFHIGHGKVFKYLKQQYKGAQVFIASSDKTDNHKSPFTFQEKKKMMQLAGVDPNSIVQCKVPYVATEITDRFDPDKTVIVYAVSEKDMAEDPRFNFPDTGMALLTRGAKKGQPAHMQKWPGIENAKPLRDHSYITTVPTFKFEIRGQAINSATQIRDMIAKADESTLEQILQDLYGNPNIPKDVMQLFQNKLQKGITNENWEEPSLYEAIMEAQLMQDMDEALSPAMARRARKKAYALKTMAKYRKASELGMDPSKVNQRRNEPTPVKEKEKSEDLLKGFDPKTARALVQLKTKYPQADNVLSALLADVEKNERDGDKADYKQEKELSKLTKAIEVLQKEIQVLKSQKGK